VDDRIPTDSADEGSVLKRERGETSLLEADVGVRPPGDGQHRARQVDTNDVEPVSCQPRRHASRPAPDVRDETRREPHELDERCEERPIDGALERRTHVNPYAAGVLLSGCVVDGSRRRHMVGLRHAAESTEPDHPDSSVFPRDSPAKTMPVGGDPKAL
jgi:hypothetical protein